MKEKNLDNPEDLKITNLLCFLDIQKALKIIDNQEERKKYLKRILEINMNYRQPFSYIKMLYDYFGIIIEDETYELVIKKASMSDCFLIAATLKNNIPNELAILLLGQFLHSQKQKSFFNILLNIFSARKKRLILEGLLKNICESKIGEMDINISEAFEMITEKINRKITPEEYTGYYKCLLKNEPDSFLKITTFNNFALDACKEKINYLLTTEDEKSSLRIPDGLAYCLATKLSELEQTEYIVKIILRKLHQMTKYEHDIVWDVTVNAKYISTEKERLAVLREAFEIFFINDDLSECWQIICSKDFSIEENLEKTERIYEKDNNMTNKLNFLMDDEPFSIENRREKLWQLFEKEIMVPSSSFLERIIKYFLPIDINQKIPTLLVKLAKEQKTEIFNQIKNSLPKNYWQENKLKVFSELDKSELIALLDR